MTHHNPVSSARMHSSATARSITGLTDHAGSQTRSRRGLRRGPGRRPGGAVDGPRAVLSDRLRPHGVTLAITGQIPEQLRERVVADYQRANLLRAHRVTRLRVAAGELPLPVPYGYRLTGPDCPGRSVWVGPSRDWRPDPRTERVVGMIFSWRVNGTAVADIVGMLAGNPSVYPRPRGRGGRERAWTAAIVRRILADPSYTGLTVWGRTERGRPVPRDQWIVSPAPTHPQLVARSVFDDVQLARRTAVAGRLPRAR